MSSTPPDLAPQPAVEQLLANRELRGRILVLAAGRGDDVVRLRAEGIEAVGLEADAASVRAAGTRAKRYGLDAPVRRFTPNELDQLVDTFDAVIDLGVFAGLSARERSAFAARVAGVLRPLGVVYVVVRSRADRRRGGPRKAAPIDFRRAFAGPVWQAQPARTTTLADAGEVYPALILSAVEVGTAAFTPTGPALPAARRAVEIAPPTAAPVETLATGLTRGVVKKRAELPPDPIAAAQKCLNWCWAAALEMLCKSQGIAIPQERFVEKIYGTKPDGTLPCLPSGTLENIQLALHGTSEPLGGRTVTLDSAIHYGIPTDPAGMIRSIVDQRPFIFGYQGHAFVCFGITWLERPPFVQITRLELIDPLWKLMPQRPQKTFFQLPAAPQVLLQINGTLELLVS